MSDKVTISRVEAEALKARARHQELLDLLSKLGKPESSTPLLKEISDKLSALTTAVGSLDFTVPETKIPDLDLTQVVKELSKVSATIQHEMARLLESQPRFPDAYEFSFSRDAEGNIKSPITVKTIYNG